MPLLCFGASPPFVLWNSLLDARVAHCSSGYLKLMFRNIMQATASLGPKNIYCGTGPLSGSLQCKGDRSLVAISLCKVLKIVLDFQLFSVNTGANTEKLLLHWRVLFSISRQMIGIQHRKLWGFYFLPYSSCLVFQIQNVVWDRTTFEIKI